MGVKILAIETSCDDTGIAILEASKTDEFKVLSNIVSSQIKVHKKYGGVYPAWQNVNIKKTWCQLLPNP